jgi:ankyrin repeat protein
MLDSSAQHLAWLHVLANTRNKSVLSDFKRTLCSDEALDSLELSPLHQTILGLMDVPFDNVLNSPAAFSSINSRDRFGRTALSWAAEKGDSGIIKELILHGADPEIACLNQWTPLRYSCVSHSSDAMRLLLDSGASPAPDPVYATTALHDVAYHKRTLEFVTPLVVAGCLLDKQDVGGRTPLAKSCESDNDIVARFLLENGANKDNVDDIASTPVNTAIQCGSNNVLRLLFEYGADYTRLTKFGDSILHTAAGFHAVTLETLDILTDAKLKGLNVALRNHSGRTPAQVLSARPDADGKLRHRFRELLESVEPPKPIVSGPMEIDAWPTTLL